MAEHFTGGKSASCAASSVAKLAKWGQTLRRKAAEDGRRSSSSVISKIYLPIRQVP